MTPLPQTARSVWLSRSIPVSEWGHGRERPLIRRAARTRAPATDDIRETIERTQEQREPRARAERESAPSRPRGRHSDRGPTSRTDYFAAHSSSNAPPDEEQIPFYF
jgi:hypothetical protein